MKTINTISPDVNRACDVHQFEVHQGDKDSREYHIILTNNAQPVTLTGTMTASADAVINDVIVAQDEALTVDTTNQYIVLTLTEEMLSMAGILKVDVKLSESGAVLTAATLSFYVGRSVINSESRIEPGGTTIGAQIITLNTRVDAAEAVINAKEVKSNKKTTLTGNENSDEFYPTTKAVADALLGINAGSVGFDETGTYASGSVGAELQEQNRQLSDVEENQIPELKNALNAIDSATSVDIGKALSPKTVVNGKVTEWKFVDGLSSDIKDALLQCFQHVEWDDAHGDEYYEDLLNALYPVVSISADYDSTHTAKTSDNLDSLRAYLTVTIHRDGVPDSTTTNYTLSGILVQGTSTITVAYAGKTTTFIVTVIQDVTTVDVVVFAGQSNMDGRGDASEAPVVQQGTAFKWDQTNQEVVDFTTEGSLIPAYVKTYYKETGVPIVEIKEATGGINITTWMSTWGTVTGSNISGCVNYLESNGKTVRSIFMLWNQGENDVTDGTTTAQYEALFAQMKSSVMSAGVEKIFVINIGQARTGYDCTDIRTALENVCDGTDVVMVSDKFYNAIQYMNSQWHYQQIVYNAVGENAAINTVYFYKTGNEPQCIPFDASDVYTIPAEYMNLSSSGWQYNKHGINAVLHDCSAVTTHVQKFGKDGDMYYVIGLAYPAGGLEHYALKGNSITKNVVIDNDVVLVSAITGVPGEYGIEFARDATELESITGIPAMGDGAKRAFNGAAKLQQAISISNMHGDLDATFANSGITAITGEGTEITLLTALAQNCTNLVSVCDLNGTYTRADNLVRGCTNLESIGVIGSTVLTKIDGMFYGCTKLSGIVKFLSSDITSAQYAFYDCDMTKIEIQVPANSTTYTTITTEYPNANVTTFTPD